MSSLATIEAIPDEDLVRRCVIGEDEAFRQLYLRYRQPVLRTARRIIRNAEDAQEITQEIFLKVYRSISDFDPAKSRLSTWLYRLASNHAIDHWRARNRRLRVETAFDSADGATERLFISHRAGPYQILAGKELAGQLRRCARKLPSLQRRLFILRHFHGFSLDEIARMEGRSLGTVKGLLFRACRTLRTRFRYQIQ